MYVATSQSDRRLEERLAGALKLWIKDGATGEATRRAPAFTLDASLIPSLLAAAHQHAGFSITIEIEKGTVHMRVKRRGTRESPLLARASARIRHAPQALARAIWTALRISCTQDEEA
jgi:hypothetical protein